MNVLNYQIFKIFTDQAPVDLQTLLDHLLELLASVLYWWFDKKRHFFSLTKKKSLLMSLEVIHQSKSANINLRQFFSSLCLFLPTNIGCRFISLSARK